MNKHLLIIDCNNNYFSEHSKLDIFDSLSITPLYLNINYNLNDIEQSFLEFEVAFDLFLSNYDIDGCIIAGLPSNDYVDVICNSIRENKLSNVYTVPQINNLNLSLNYEQHLKIKELVSLSNVVLFDVVQARNYLKTNNINANDYESELNKIVSNNSADFILTNQYENNVHKEIIIKDNKTKLILNDYVKKEHNYVFWNNIFSLMFCTYFVTNQDIMKSCVNANVKTNQILNRWLNNGD